MTAQKRKRAERYLDVILTSKSVTVSKIARKVLMEYRAEHERMRQFIRNLADESRVYLESEE